MGAFDGNGTFVRTYSWTADKVNGINITASRVDTEDNGFAAGLTNCVTRDGQGKMGADFLPSVASTYALGSVSLPWTTLNGTSIATMIQSKVFKLSDTSIASSTTLTDDPELISPNLVNGNYAYEILLLVSGATTSAQGFKRQLTFTGTTLFRNEITFKSVSGSSVVATQNFRSQIVDLNPNVMVDTGTSGPTDYQFIKGSILVNSPGQLKVQWAQNTSSANVTSVLHNSYMIVTRVS